jgi:hypothetical protein
MDCLGGQLERGELDKKGWPKNDQNWPKRWKRKLERKNEKSSGHLRIGISLYWTLIWALINNSCIFAYSNMNKWPSIGTNLLYFGRGRRLQMKEREREIKWFLFVYAEVACSVSSNFDCNSFAFVCLLFWLGQSPFLEHFPPQFTARFICPSQLYWILFAKEWSSHFAD